MLKDFTFLNFEVIKNLPVFKLDADIISIGKTGALSYAADKLYTHYLLSQD